MRTGTGTTTGTYTPGTGAVPTGDPTGPATGTPGLTADQRNAYNAVVAILKQYGLEGLAGHILNYVRDGYSQDTIMLELQNTNEWKTRFAGNEARKKAGLPLLSPAEYLSVENSYREIMRTAGVPAGFYDSYTDFADFIGKDVSPTEMNARVKTATDFVNRADPKQLAYMRQHYTKGDLIAAALDPAKAVPLIEKQFAAATIGGNAAAAGLTVGTTMAEKLAAAGVDDGASRAGFGVLGSAKPTLDKLAALDAGHALTADELAAGTFLHDAAITDAVDRLKQREAGRFSGSSALGKDSLARPTGGI